ARFVPCGATQPESAGWVPPRGDKHAVLAENVGGQIILKLCTETRAVPGTVVKTELEAQLDKIEQDTGRRLKGKKAREIKEEIIHTLLPRAFPKRGHTLVWLDVKAGLVLVDTGSMKKADGVLTRLSELLGGGLKMSPLQTTLSPATAMAAWLSEQEAPAGFTLDRDCELKQPDSEKATVRYARHTLDIAEVGEHIKQGKLPTQLGMTWASRVSFVLTEAGTMKKIKLLDVVLESGKSGGSGDEQGFDTDVALATGELARLIPELVAALGGPLVRDASTPAAVEAATAAPAAAGSQTAPPWEDAA
ncbi:MAG: recombination-associated protein RdgC, partial [Rubrivivax sp.]|nr:recombination-associated protein RdgC [Rubrivivax sp.]